MSDKYFDGKFKIKYIDICQLIVLLSNYYLRYKKKSFWFSGAFKMFYYGIICVNSFESEKNNSTDLGISTSHAKMENTYYFEECTLCQKRDLYL